MSNFMIGITILSVFSFVACLSGTIFALKVLKKRKEEND